MGVAVEKDKVEESACESSLEGRWKVESMLCTRAVLKLTTGEVGCEPRPKLGTGNSASLLFLTLPQSPTIPAGIKHATISAKAGGAASLLEEAGKAKSVIHRMSGRTRRT